jgi:hypothetical protein
MTRAINRIDSRKGKWDLIAMGVRDILTTLSDR